MIDRWSRVVALSAVALVMLSGALAAQTPTEHYVVVDPTDFVAPGSLSGWALGIQQGWNYDGTNFVWVQATMPTCELALGAMVPPLGFRSLHIVNPYSTGDSGDPAAHPPNKVYVGTNEFAGIALEDIVTFKYSTFLQYRDYGVDQRFLGQPPQIEIITDSGSSAQKRMFSYKPWGFGGASNVEMGRWQEWDLLADGGYWVMAQTSSTNEHGNWNWLKNRYVGGMKLQMPAVGDYTAGMANQSGTAISIKVGSGTTLYLNNNPPLTYQAAWWPEASGINAYADKLVIGVRRGDGSIDEYTYDFDDPAASPLDSPVAMSNRAAAEPIVTPQAGKRPIVIYGKVGTYVGDYHAGLYLHVYDGSTNADGSPSWVRIYSPGNTVPQPGEFSQLYVRAKGRLDNTAATKVLYANPEDITFWEIPLW